MAASSGVTVPYGRWEGMKLSPTPSRLDQISDPADRDRAVVMFAALHQLDDPHQEPVVKLLEVDRLSGAFWLLHAYGPAGLSDSDRAVVKEACDSGSLVYIKYNIAAESKATFRGVKMRGAVVVAMRSHVVPARSDTPSLTSQDRAARLMKPVIAPKKTKKIKDRRGFFLRTMDALIGARPEKAAELADTLASPPSSAQ